MEEKKERMYFLFFWIFINLIFLGLILYLDESYFETWYGLSIMGFIYIFILFFISLLFSYYKYQKSDKSMSFWKFFNIHPYYTRTSEEQNKIEKKVTPYIAGFIVIGCSIVVSIISYILLYFEFDGTPGFLYIFLLMLIVDIIFLIVLVYYSYVFYKHFHEKHEESKNN